MSQLTLETNGTLHLCTLMMSQLTLIVSQLTLETYGT